MHYLIQIGWDVILYEVVRSDTAMAKGTIISVNPKTTLGGVALGKHYCEVVMNLVIKKGCNSASPLYRCGEDG